MLGPWKQGVIASCEVEMGVIAGDCRRLQEEVPGREPETIGTEGEGNIGTTQILHAELGLSPSFSCYCVTLHTAIHHSQPLSQ